jgi:hypothetical protein
MTKEEAKAFLDKIGVKVGEITDDIAEKVEDYKATLDTETRRTVRTFWAVVSVIAFVAGVAVGHFLF